MRSERNRLYSDPEVVELLQDDPELLAIVDAIAATQSRPERQRAAEPLRVAAASARAVGTSLVLRRRRVLATLAGTTAAVVILVVLAPWQGRGPLATELALAAIGDQPVIHAVVASTRPRATVVDLGSGRQRLEFLQTEFWHDDERSRLRMRVTIDGRLITEILKTGGRATSDQGPVRGNLGQHALDPALAWFASGYREALEAGRAEVLGKTIVDGQPAILLRLQLGERVETQPSAYQEVAVDSSSYRPLRFRVRRGEETSPWWRVVAIDTGSRDEQDFAAPTPGDPRPARQTATTERSLTTDEAATVLQRPAVWPGAAVGGLELTNVELLKLVTQWSDGRETEAPALRFRYTPGLPAAKSAQDLIITQTTSADLLPNSGATAGRQTLEPQQLSITGVGDLDGSPVDNWFGMMRIDGNFVSLESRNRDVIVAAAKAMKPIKHP